MVHRNAVTYHEDAAYFQTLVNECFFLIAIAYTLAYIIATTINNSNGSV